MTTETSMADTPDSNHPGLRWDEYKLLQDKLDRIGDFRFRVKTWVVSLAGLFVVGGAALKVGWSGVAVSVALVPLFWMLEHYYNKLERALGARLRVLEAELQRGEYNALPDHARKAGRRTVGPRIVVAVDGAFAPHPLVRRTHDAFYVGALSILLLLSIALSLSDSRNAQVPTSCLIQCVASDTAPMNPAPVTSRIPVADEGAGDSGIHAVPRHERLQATEPDAETSESQRTLERNR